MIKRIYRLIRERVSSLYVSMFLSVILSLTVATLSFFIFYIGSHGLIYGQLGNEEARAQREDALIEELRSYAAANDISSKDIKALSEWTQQHEYAYILLYKGEELFFISEVNVPHDSSFVVDVPSREEILQSAQENEKYEIELSDGAVMAAVSDFSECFYYDVASVISLVTAFAVLIFMIINHFRTVVARIKRLEMDVALVSMGNTDHVIKAKGYDEISRLSKNVDNMRNSILETLRKERDARDANTELITAMSHDIRTPLTVLLGYLEIMKESVEGDEVLSEYVLSSERTAMRLKQLSDDMFKYSLAFGNATEGITLEEYDARVLFEQLLSEHVVLLRESGKDVIFSDKSYIIPADATVMTDAQNLMRIVDNIFSNLNKYADELSPIFISIEVKAGQTVTLECKNSPRADTSKIESSGIGLKTCSRLAGFVANGFSYGMEGELFTVRLSLKIKMPEGAANE